MNTILKKKIIIHVKSKKFKNQKNFKNQKKSKKFQKNQKNFKKLKKKINTKIKIIYTTTYNSLLYHIATSTNTPSSS